MARTKLMKMTTRTKMTKILKMMKRMKKTQKVLRRVIWKRTMNTESDKEHESEDETLQIINHLTKALKVIASERHKKS